MHAEYPHNQFCGRLKCPNLLGSLIWGSGPIPLGCHYSAITMTFSFFESDKPVYTTASHRAFSPCQPTQDASTQGWGARCGIPRFWTCSDRKRSHHIKTLELNSVILALHHWVSVLRDHQLMIATANTL